MSFQLPTQGVSQICELLLGASSIDNAVQRKVHEEVENLSLSVPEFPCYLAHIMATPEYENEHLRIFAAYALKSYINLHFDLFQDATLVYVKDHLLNAMEDKNLQLGSVAGTVVSLLLARLSIDKWPEAIDRFSLLISDTNRVGFSVRIFSLSFSLHSFIHFYFRIY